MEGTQFLLTYLPHDESTPINKSFFWKTDPLQPPTLPILFSTIYSLFPSLSHKPLLKLYAPALCDTPIHNEVIFRQVLESVSLQGSFFIHIKILNCQSPLSVMCQSIASALLEERKEQLKEIVEDCFISGMVSISQGLSFLPELEKEQRGGNKQEIRQPKSFLHKAGKFVETTVSKAKKVIEKISGKENRLKMCTMHPTSQLIVLAKPDSIVFANLIFENNGTEPWNTPVIIYQPKKPLPRISFEPILLCCEDRDIGINPKCALAAVIPIQAPTIAGKYSVALRIKDRNGEKLGTTFVVTVLVL